MWNGALVTAVLLLTVLLLLTKKASLGWIGLLIPCLLSASGILSAKDAFAGLADKSMFVFVGAFVISEAFFKVGLAGKLSDGIGKKLEHIRNEAMILLLLCLVTAAMSAFMSSLGVQVAMLSLVLALGTSLQVSRAKVMMAIGYSATIGGMMTLVGTPLNMVGKAAYEDAVPGGVMGVFEISLIALPVGIAMILYFCLIGSRCLPDCKDQDFTGKSETGKRSENQSDCGFGDKIKYKNGTKYSIQNKNEYKPESPDPKNRRNQLITVCSFFLFLILIVLDGNTWISSSVAGALVLLLIGGAKILTAEEMAQSIRWDILMFIMGIQALGKGITSAGLDMLLSEQAAILFGNGVPDRLLIGIVFLIVVTITQFLNNTGTFGVVLPFVLMLSSTLHVHLKPVMITAMVAASSSFVLPIAAPTYPMLAEEGNIRFRDWMIQGLPLVCIGPAGCVIGIPLLWPL